MAEKIISEIRFIETEDGFRIEIKGDKERWRNMGFQPEMGFGSGRHQRRRGWHHGPWKRRHFGGFGPWMWRWDCWGEDRDEEDSAKNPPKDF